MKFNKDDKAVMPKKSKEIEEIVIDGAVMHKVTKGDTLKSIAEDHGVTEQDIKSLNRKDMLFNMKVGQLIRVK